VRRTDTAGSRSESVRQANLSALLRTLHLDGSATRSGLVAHSGLTRSAVGALVGELADLSYVYEQRSASGGSPGRPSPMVLPVADHVTIAMEIFVDSLAVAAISLGGHVLDRRRIDRGRHQLPVHDTVAALVELASEMLAELPDTLVVHGIGVTIAGVVRRSDQRVIIAPNIGWRDVPLGDLVRQQLPIDVPVVIANDGDLGAFAEVRRGVATDMSDVVYISGEVGVGAGVITDGRPLGGAEGFAGEVGHIPVNPGGLPCKCGSSGCWETEVGEEALLRRARRSTDGGRAAVDDVLAAAASGDPDVLAAMDAHGRWLGFGLAGIINTFDPDVVVMGGLFARLFPYVSPALESELDLRVFDVVRQQVGVLPSGLGLDGPLLGAAEWAWERVLADPAGAGRPQHWTVKPSAVGNV
jgi:predicted NBD/HSP70 family sugar kinase